MQWFEPPNGLILSMVLIIIAVPQYAKTLCHLFQVGLGRFQRNLIRMHDIYVSNIFLDQSLIWIPRSTTKT